MIHFTQPNLLWLAVLIPPVLYLWLRHPRTTVRHPRSDLFPPRASGRASLAHWGGLLLRGLALFALVIAIAGPRWPDLRTEIEAEGIAIGMVVDVSKSMGDKDFPLGNEKVTRLDAVKRTFRLFIKGGEAAGGVRLQGRRTDAVSLIVFGERPDVTCPLTFRHTTLLQILENQQPRELTGESRTNIIDAVALALHNLDPPDVSTRLPKRKVLVLLTDGEDTVPHSISNLTLSDVIRYAKGLQIPIYSLDAAGTKIAGDTPKEREEAEEKRQAVIEALQALAEKTGGRYFKVDSTEQLLDTYRIIDQKERVPIRTSQYRRYHEGYPWFALSGLLLYQLVLVLEMTTWRRVP